jgi:hypothetical protein
MTVRVSDTTSDDDDNASVIYPLLGRATHTVVGHSISHTQQWVNETSSSEAGCVGNGRSGKEKPKGSKKHCCKFCDKLNSKMSTHLTRCHSEEPEVAQILKMRKGEPDRRMAFIKLQDDGDFQHNYRVLRDKKGPEHLIPKYRKATGTRQESDYRACPHCKAIYLKTLLSKHERRCRQKADGKRMKRGQCALLGSMLFPVPHGTTPAFFEKVISKLRDDEISRLIQNDSLMLRYGERLFSRRDIEEHSYGQINGRLRELGRLCQLLRNASGMTVSSLTQAIDPINFDLLVAKVKELGQFSASSNMCGKGSLVLKLGYSLRKCNTILKAESIKNNDAELRDRCERFESLYSGDWFDRVSASASQSVQRARMNRPKLLPSVADVEKVNCLLEKESQSESYSTQAKATLAAVTIFNRKRGGEVQRMKCSDYEQSKIANRNPPEEEIMSNLTNTEKKLVKQLHRVEIRGKFNRPVPILLTPKMVQNIEKLVAQHTLLGLDSDYLFITPTGERPFRGPAVLKEYAQKAQVSDPSLFTATTLRKQLATLSQAMAISELGQDQLASFLGHDIRIHRSIYCQTLDVVQKAKVASVLLKVNRGVQLTDDMCDDVELEDEVIDPDPDEAQRTAGTSDEEEEGCSMDQEEGEGESSGPHMEPAEKNSSQKTGHSTPPPQPAKQKQPRQVQKKKPWTEEEKQAVHRQLSECFVLGKVPQKHECQKALATELVLRHRTWKDVKYFVYNQLKKRC